MGLDPSSTPSSHSNSSVGNGDSNGELANGSGLARQPVDPPEEMVEMATRSSFPSSFHKGKRPSAKPLSNGKVTFAVPNGDNHVDEQEMEGLIGSANSTSSSVGAGGRLRSQAQTLFMKHSAPVMAAWSLAWDPRNRTRSTIAMLFLGFLCTIALTKNDVDASHEGFFSRANCKSGGCNNDPMSHLSPDERNSLLKKVYGSWTFYDGGAEDRPKEPYMTVENAGNPYLDLPEDKFPEESWQADAVYANHFLDAAEKLVRRGQQAIFSTYHGYGLSDVEVVKEGDRERVDYTPENPDERITKRLTMFHLQEVDLGTVTSKAELQAAAPDWQKTAGWTTKRSFDGLERRLIHAIMTESPFVVVITGNWQNMGYGGNHDWQSMPGVFETIMKPLFEKVGVKLVVRAIGLPPMDDLNVEDLADLLDGGKSTLVHALGWSSIYGSDVDMVVWDDYSTLHDDDDKSSHDLNEVAAQLFDLFARQALLSGTTSLPFIWGGDFNVLRNLHEHADVDVGQLGNGLVGIQQTMSERTVNNIPWAAQYLNCQRGMRTTCQKDSNQFASQCWIERSDITPTTPQFDSIQILPTAIGWRMQQLKGYTLAYVFLQATLDAINQVSEITIAQGFPLADEYWHMGDYIKNVQEKVKTLDETAAPHCFKLQETMSLPKRLCQNRLQGRTEYTPRANPTETSLRTILDPTQVPKVTPQLLYQGDDVENPLREVPRGEVDALEIMDLQGKRRRRQRLLRTRNVPRIVMPQNGSIYDNAKALYRRRIEEVKVEPGKGWQLLHSYGDGCDGSLSSSSTCGRLSTSSCLMEGHQGSRGGIWGNEATGWLVFRGIKTENGFIALNLEFGGREQSRRSLLESLPDSFALEYAAGGISTTLDKTQLLEKLQKPTPDMGLLVVLDENGSGDKEETVAVRVRGCSDEVACQFAVTHVYW
eukprot:CAMPEP_0183713210 /NCGR_PEP_ID=MMETSP0737-20130205/8121_1 /TAXON_ID=385413 /ORGANISM="Thalassiosira miniscula, Strain CCMP1093" /LENGTH=931 /DNA_ID=CAMNT_0025941961 /DNA_START=65 /DNA_END=2857 /DNA_ORIENTATION=+